MTGRGGLPELNASRWEQQVALVDLNFDWMIRR